MPGKFPFSFKDYWILLEWRRKYVDFGYFRAFPRIHLNKNRDQSELAEYTVVTFLLLQTHFSIEKSTIQATHISNLYIRTSESM